MPQNKSPKYKPQAALALTDRTLAAIRIGQAATLTGLSPSALRLYESLGLVLPFKEEGGQRLYSLSDIEWIRKLRKYVEQRQLGPRAVSWVLHWVPLYQLRCAVFKHDPCGIEVVPGKAICWTLNADDPEWRKLCRACPAYQNKDAALDFKAFEISLREQHRSL